MSYTVKYDAGEIQDNITTIDKPTIQIDSPRNSKGEITATEIDLTFADPAVDGESATLIKNNLKLANLNRGAIVLDQDTTQNSITVDNLESSTAYQATLTQYAEEQIEAYSKVDFSTAQEAPFSISTDTITLKQGASVEIPFTNDGCSLTAFTDYNLINVVQNSNTFGLSAVTDDMGSDHLTIVATKNGFMPKTVQMTVIVPDVVIECSPLAISIDGDVDEYKDVVVTTNGDSISYSINNDNVTVEQLSVSNDGLTATYRVYGESDGGSVITFNALVDGNVVESCTCGVTLSNMYEPQIAFTANSAKSNVNIFESDSIQKHYNIEDYDVYINGSLTNQRINALSYNANDKVVIKKNNFTKNSVFPNCRFPILDPKSIDAPLPIMSRSNDVGSRLFTESCTFKGCTALSSIPRGLFKNNTNLLDCRWMFQNCTSLTSIPQDLFKYNVKVTTFENCFQNCTSLTSIPQDLFRYNVNVTILRSCFSGCTSLTFIPQDLFRYNVNVNDVDYDGFGSCFSGCTSLTFIPQDLFRYNVNATRFAGTFYGCTSLTSIPQDLFRYNVNATKNQGKNDYSSDHSSFSSCFYGCTSLTSIPQDLFKYVPIESEFTSTFRGCTSLTSIPQDLFKYSTKATKFTYCFSDCTLLTTVPSDLFEYNTEMKEVSHVFRNCSNITSAIPVLWQSNGNPLEKYSKITGHSYYALSCTQASNYADIPSGWK